MNGITYGQALLELLNHPQYQHALGLLFVMALIIGGILNDGKKMLLHWVTAILFAAFGLEYTRSVYWTLHPDFVNLSQGQALTTVGVITYLFGLTIGWCITTQAKYQAKRKIIQERLRILAEKEKTNGNLAEKS